LRLTAGMFAALSLSDSARNCSMTPLGMFVSVVVCCLRSLRPVRIGVRMIHV
jgi:hypothetical protein